jgi:hypothetical protein
MSRALPLAGFQVTLIGRFSLIPEDKSELDVIATGKSHVCALDSGGI